MAYNPEEATRLVNQVMGELGVEFVIGLICERFGEITGPYGEVVTKEKIVEIVEVTNRNSTQGTNRLIETIKAVRHVLGYGLKEASQFVEVNKGLFGLR